MRLLILLCDLANPTACVEVVHPSDAIGIIDCMKSSPTYGAEVQTTLSRWRVERVRCDVDPEAIGVVTGSITPRPFGPDR